MSRRLAYVVWMAGACGLVLPGCTGGTDPVSSTTRPALPAATPLAAAAKPATSRPPLAVPAAQIKPGEEYVLLVKLGVTAIEAPVGTISSSEQVWAYLNEEPVAVGRSAGLARNGLRIGTGKKENWQDLARVLKRLTGRSLDQTITMAYPGAPIRVELKRAQPVQTVFIHFEDRSMGGHDYPPGDNLLALSCTFDLDDPSTILVTGLPQIRSTHRSPKIINEMSRMLVVEKPTFFSFSDLTFQLRLPNSDFIVVGPGTQSRRPSSVGHHFLVKDKDGIEFETILILTPEIIAAPVRQNTGEFLSGTKNPG